MYRAEQEEESFFVVIARGFGHAVRLVLPVTSLLLALALSYQTMGIYVTVFDRFFPAEQWYLHPGYWLTAGHFILPWSFFAIILTNRAYGAGYAAAQVLITWTLIIGGYLFLAPGLEAVAAASLIPPMRVTTAFLAGIIIGQLVCIYIFDQVRGRPWWRAPLYSALYGSLFFCVIYYSASKLGVEAVWFNKLAVDLAVKVGMAMVMLLPYAILRPLIRPLPGFGGA